MATPLAVTNLPWVEKYRPESLDDLISQKEIVSLLLTTDTLLIYANFDVSDSFRPYFQLPLQLYRPTRLTAWESLSTVAVRLWWDLWYARYMITFRHDLVRQDWSLTGGQSKLRGFLFVFALVLHES